MGTYKRMSKREKVILAKAKRELQKEGILPPNKPKLNRKKYIKEAEAAWDWRDKNMFGWEYYLLRGIYLVMMHREGRSTRSSLAAVGAAKVLNLALRIREFEEMLKARGEHEFKTEDYYNYIKDILEA